MAKSYSICGIQYNQCYSVEDISLMLGVHVQTVREWIREGLQIIDKQKPTLIWGECLKNWVNRLNDARAIPTNFDEFFCFNCHKSHLPLGRKIFLEQSNNFIKATGICGNSKKLMFKSYKMDDVPKINEYFEITEVSRLYDSVGLAYNTHICETSEVGISEPVQMNFPKLLSDNGVLNA